MWKETGAFDFQKESKNFLDLFNKGTVPGKGKTTHGTYILYALMAISVYTLA